MQKGKVYIIGAGPGDYKLLTLKAVECISIADVIVYDRLINERILSLARQDAELVYAGKMPDSHTLPQNCINEILAAKAQEGKTVARLKGGDPFVFGRGGEECEYLCERGISFEIVPGITSAVAAPAYAGIPLTHRDYSSSFHVIAGHESNEKENNHIDYACLARCEGTLVFLMGVSNIDKICEELIYHGKDADTPAAIIQRGTTQMQRVVAGTLGNIALKSKTENIKAPAVIIIGEVVQLRDKLHWFYKKPLSGKRIVVARAKEDAPGFADMIEEAGGEPVLIPAIKTIPTDIDVEFENIIKNMHTFSWLVFTSRKGVKYFFDKLKQCNIDIRHLAGIKICAIGEETKSEVEQRGIFVDYVPQSYTTGDLLKGLLERVDRGQKVLLARSDIANKELFDGLVDSGIDCVDLTVYKTILNSNIDAERILQEKTDFVAFTSASTVKAFGMIPIETKKRIFETAKVVCIGPVTAKTAEEEGIKVFAVADVYTLKGLMDKIIEISN